MKLLAALLTVLALATARAQLLVQVQPPPPQKISFGWDYPTNFRNGIALRLNVYSTTKITWTRDDTNAALTWIVRTFDRSAWPPGYSTPIVNILPISAKNLPPLNTWPLYASLETWPEFPRKIEIPKDVPARFVVIAFSNTVSHTQSEYAQR